MARVWTEEQKQRQRERIQEWKPWEKSTGPRTAAGKQASSRNAYKNGLWLTMRALLKKVTWFVRMQKALGKYPPKR